MKVHHDPLANQPASPADIKQARHTIEALPIVDAITGLAFDFDERSEKRMAGILDYWPEGMPTIDWRLADNSTTALGLEELMAIFDRLLNQRVQRALQVYDEYRQKRETPGLTRRDLENWKATYVL